jgi:hypothetical protein
VSTYGEREREREGAAASIAGFLAAAALFVSLIGIAYKPVRLVPAAVVVALIALGMGGRHQRLAAFALAAAVVAWVVGMTVAVATDRPLY